MKKLVHLSMVAFAAVLLIAHDADAQRRGGGGGRGGGGFRGGGGGGGGFRGGGGGGRGGGGFSGGARSSARSSVTSRPSRSSFSGGGRSFDRTPNVDRVDRTPRVDRVDRTPRVDRGDINRGNFDRGNISIDRDITIDNDNGGWWDRDYFGCCDHPLAATAALGAAAAYGYAAGNVGEYYSTLPYYGGCTESVVNGVVYWDCNNNWYQPAFYGVDAAYVAVTAPQ